MGLALDVGLAGLTLGIDPAGIESFFVACDAGSVLVHTHDGRIDHLHSRVMFGVQCLHANASPSPANEAIVASRVRPKTIRQIAPRDPNLQAYQSVAR